MHCLTVDPVNSTNICMIQAELFHHVQMKVMQKCLTLTPVLQDNTSQTVHH